MVQVTIAHEQQAFREVRGETAASVQPEVQDIEVDIQARIDGVRESIAEFAYVIDFTTELEGKRETAVVRLAVADK